MSFCKPFIALLVGFGLSSAAFAVTTDQIVFVNKLVGDKKTWVPEGALLEFKQGSTVNVTLKNDLNDPHGFFIKGMTDPILVPGKLAGGVAPEIKFSMKVTDKPGRYDFMCHMHPAHVGGSFSVVK